MKQEGGMNPTNLRKGEPKTRVKDVEEARTMAEAGDENETEASRIRQYASLVDALSKEWRSLDKKRPRHSVSEKEIRSFADKEKVFFIESGKKIKRVQRPFILDEELGSDSELEKIGRNQISTDGSGYFEDSPREEREVEYNQKQADNNELIAQLVYRHPEVKNSKGDNPTLHEVMYAWEICSESNAIVEIIENLIQKINSGESDDIYWYGDGGTYGKLKGRFIGLLIRTNRDDLYPQWNSPGTISSDAKVENKAIETYKKMLKKEETTIGDLHKFSTNFLNKMKDIMLELLREFENYKPIFSELEKSKE